MPVLQRAGRDEGDRGNASLQTRVQISRTHVKPNAAACICNPNTPTANRKWRREQKNSRKYVSFLTWQMWRQTRREPCLKQRRGQVMDTQGCPLASTHASWVHAYIYDTHIHTHHTHWRQTGLQKHKCSRIRHGDTISIANSFLLKYMHV